MVVISKGAKAVGRIRMLERNTGRDAAWAVSVEFRQIVAAGARYRFLAYLEQIGPVPGLFRDLTSTRNTADAQPMTGDCAAGSSNRPVSKPFPG